MTACDRIILLLSCYLEGETSHTETTEIRGHLKACGECRSEYVELKATVELVRGLPQIATSEGFEASVLARLRSAGVVEVGARPAQQAFGTPAFEDREPGDFVHAGRPRPVTLAGSWGEDHWWDGWLPRFAAAAAAAAVVAISMVGTHELAQRQQAKQEMLVARTNGGVSSSVATLHGPSRLGTADFTSRDVSNSGQNPQYDDLHSRFPDIPAEVIRAMPLNGETYAADRMVAQPWSSAAGAQLLAPVDFHGEEKVYIYR